MASLASPSPGASLAGLTGSPNPGTNSDLAALAALANYTGVGVSSNQHPLTLGLQAAIAAAINGGHSALSQGIDPEIDLRLTLFLFTPNF